MWSAAAALVAATLAAAPAMDRVLVCRARITGDPALARGDAIADAVRERGARLLDYGVPCDSAAEAARAARRAGLAHAVHGVAEGRTEGSLYELTVVTADDRVVEVRRLAIPPGEDVARAVGAALDGVVGELRRPQVRELQQKAALGVAGGGAALIVAGIALAAGARADAGRANGAETPDEYLAAKASWRTSRGLSATAFGLGGAALAGGLAWRFGLEE